MTSNSTVKMAIFTSIANKVTNQVSIFLVPASAQSMQYANRGTVRNEIS